MSLPAQRWLFAVAGLGGLAMLAWVYTQVPIAEWIVVLRQWIVSFGFYGLALFIVIYVMATVCLGPVSALNLMAGLAYGVWGFPLVVISATLGALVAFMLGRYVAHAHVDRWIARKPKLLALQRAVSEEGWRVVGLLRLSPVIPFGLQNYLFSVTHVGILAYVLATMIGIMPVAAFYVYIGSLGQSLGTAGPFQWVLVLAGLSATVLIAWMVGRRATQSLEKHTQVDTLDERAET